MKRAPTICDPDPAVQAAEQKAVWMQRFNELDRLPASDDQIMQTYRNHERTDLLDRAIVLRKYLSTVRATSLAGALAQLEEVDTLIEECVAGDDAARLKRLVFSILAVLAARAPASILARIGAGSWDYRDPWAPHEEAVAKIRKSLPVERSAGELHAVK